MKGREKEYLKYLCYSIIFLFVVAQIITVLIYKHTPQYSDARDYQVLAEYCYEQQTFYPDHSHIYSYYIFNPGYVNYLLMHLHVFGSFEYVSFFNILFNLLILLELFILVKCFLGRNAAYIASILYCLLPSNIMLSHPHLTELPFLVFLLGGICLLKKNSIFSLFLAGFLMVIANWIRPIALLFLLPVLIYMLINKYGIKDYAVFFFSLFLGIATIGVTTKNNCNYFIYQASTGGFNLIQGANDDMNGGYEQSCFKPGKIGYIENINHLTFQERDSIWKARSVEWIMEHPFKYIAYVPVKFARMWWGDKYLDGFYSGEAFYSSNPDFKDKIQRVASSVFFNITYYFMIISCILSLYEIWKKRNYKLLILLIPLLLGTAMQCLIYGTQRYHQPYMPIIIFFSAAWISMKLDKRLNSL